MEHKWLRLFVDGEWTGRQDRMVRVNGSEHSIDLPEGKKTKTKVNSNEGIRYKDESGDDSDSGDGVSESTE